MPVSEMPYAAQAHEVEADPIARQIFGLLDSTFGGGTWRLSDDDRYAEELGFRPVEVFVRLEEQAEMNLAAMRLEEKISDDLGVNTLIFVAATQE